MSSLKTNIESPKRASLNTTIDREIFEQFKMNCKTSGIPMNVLIEAFMRQYNEGGFNLKFGKTKHIEVNLSDAKEEKVIRTEFGEM